MKWVYAILALVVVLAIVMGVTAIFSAPPTLVPKPDGPETKAAKALVATADDYREAGNVIDAGVARPVACGRVATHAFDSHTGSARVWTWRQADGGIIECYDTPGFHRTGRGALRAITTLEVDEVLANPGTYPGYKFATTATAPAPAPTPCPQARPAPVATPLPELGQGPCCPDR